MCVCVSVYTYNSPTSVCSSLCPTLFVKRHVVNKMVNIENVPLGQTTAENLFIIYLSNIRHRISKINILYI
jgi:hypothetical protein